MPFRIGGRSAALDDLLGQMKLREAVLLGAWNPGGRRLPPGLNRRRQRALEQQLLRLPTRPAAGFGPAWHEAHLLAGLAWPRGVTVARRFGQAAIVGLRQKQGPKLIWVD